MRIAVVGNRLSGVRSGAHLAHLELAGFLARRGHDVRYAARKGQPVTRHGVPVTVGSQALQDASAWADWVLARDEPRAATVLTHVRARTLYTCHSPAGAPQTLGIRLPAGSRVVFVSRALRQNVERFHGPACGVVIEGCPMDLARYRTTPGERVTLINLSARKGGPLFWELAERMRDVQFLGVRLWGDQVVPSRIPPNVTVWDPQPDARRIYAQTRILLAPSAEAGTVPARRLPLWGESWMRSPVEAAASGIPTIAHPASGIIASMGDAAIYIDRGDTDGWEREIRRLLTDPGHHAERSHIALRRADEVAQMREAILDQYEAILEAA